MSTRKPSIIAGPYARPPLTPKQVPGPASRANPPSLPPILYSDPVYVVPRIIRGFKEPEVVGIGHLPADGSETTFEVRAPGHLVLDLEIIFTGWTRRSRVNKLSSSDLIAALSYIVHRPLAPTPELLRPRRCALRRIACATRRLG